MENIGRYQVKQRIGRGGMSTVYLAEDPKIKREVAIKVFKHETFKGDKKTLELFYKEAESSGKLSHPNIVTIHDIGEEKGIPYIVMEYLDGKSLAALLEQTYHFTVEDALDITIQLCSALEYAHKKRVIHRDIKPGNITLLSDGEIKLTDFGIAKIIGSSSKKDLGSRIGTPGYMSPEQIDGKTADYRTDIFSTGIVLYELLTGVRAFKGKTLEEIRRKISKMELIPPSQKRSDIPVGIDEIVFRALAVNPEERFQKISEFKEDLKACKKKLGKKKEHLRERVPPIPVEPIQVPKDVKTVPISRKRTPVFLLMGVGVVIVAAIIISFSTFKKSTSEKSEKRRNQSYQPVSSISKQPDIDSLIREGDNYLKSKEIDRAMDFFLDATKIDKKSPKAHYKLAETYFLQRFYRAAIESYEKALEYDPGMARAHYKIAESIMLKDNEYEKENLEKAREHCVKAIRKNPRLEVAKKLKREIEKKIAIEFAPPSPTPKPVPQETRQLKPPVKTFGFLSVTKTTPAASCSVYKNGIAVPVLNNLSTPFINKRIETGRYKIRFTIVATKERLDDWITISENQTKVIRKTFTADVTIITFPSSLVIIDYKKTVQQPTTIPLEVGEHYFYAEKLEKGLNKIIFLHKPNRIVIK